MADIVERLRRWSEFGYGVEAMATMKEAAAEIERLRAVVEVFACDCEGKAICLGNCMHRNARAALEGKHD